MKKESVKFTTTPAATEVEVNAFAKGKAIPKSEFERILNSAKVIDLTTVKDVANLAEGIKPNNVSKECAHD